MPMMGAFGKKAVLATAMAAATKPKQTRTSSRSLGAKVVATKPRQATRTSSRSLGAKAVATKPKQATGTSSTRSRSSRSSGVIAEAASSSSTTAPSRRVDLPSTLKIWLDTWGPKLRLIVEQVRAGWPQSSGVPVQFRSFARAGLRVGTDCSGADAPIWALRCLGIAFQHLFSCDHQPTIQEFLRATSPPLQSLFSDMLQRPVADIPDIDIYVCGFPCTPYSTLRAHKTKLFREAAAKPYFALVKVLREKKPPLAILENVVGLGRVVQKVLRDWQRLRQYYVWRMNINSVDMGEPMGRPRYFCAKCLGAASAPVKDHVSTRMLPNDHPEVPAFLQQQAQTPPRREKGTKWQKAHEKFRQQVLRFRGGLQSTMPLASVRAREVWTLHQRRAGTNNVIADVSQSIDRVHP